MTAATLGDYRLIPINQVHPASDNPRRNRGGLEELADSIKAQGILEPLIVEANGNGFRIIAGERRWAAAKLAKLTEVPCVVREMRERGRREAMLVENLQRRGLLPLEEAEAFETMVKELGYTQKEIAERIGKSQTYVSNRMALLYLPAYQQTQIQRGKLKPSNALNAGAAGPGPVDLFDADDELQAAWRAVRQDAIDSGDRTTIKLLAAFAKAFQAYKAALERRYIPAGSL
jgi:ParB/RepB/Spo0J family partition protein